MPREKDSRPRLRHPRSGKLSCAVPNCTLRRVLEYLPQSTLTDSGRCGKASGNAGRGLAKKKRLRRSSKQSPIYITSKSAASRPNGNKRPHRMPPGRKNFPLQHGLYEKLTHRHRKNIKKKRPQKFAGLKKVRTFATANEKQRFRFSPQPKFPKPKRGRLAQLVQSVCLTSRGSGVRIPQRPHLLRLLSSTE